MSTVLRAAALVPGVVAGVVLAAYAFAEAGTASGLVAIAAIAALFALALFWGDSPLRQGADRGLSAAIALLPGALVVYLGFEQGGFFAADTAFVVVVLATALLMRTVISSDPLEGFSWPLLVAGAALAGFAAWTLASGSWSGVPARALVEADRALAYLLALVLFGSIPRTALRLRWMLRGLVVGILVVCLAGLVTRVAPEVWAAPLGFSDNRLRYPITYWNALGLLAALGAILCVHGTSDAREPAAVRVLAAGALPALAATVLLTVSRGAVLAAIGGVLVYLLVGRPRLALSGILATALPTALVLGATNERQILFSPEYVSPAGMAEGAGLARQLIAYALIAMVVRAVLLLLDRGLVRARLPDRTRRPVIAGLWAAGAAVALVTALALGVPSVVDAQYERALRTEPPPRYGSFTGRLADPTSPGRLRQWGVAMADYRSAPLAGRGAGTWEVSWYERRGGYVAEDAHSLYIEVLGELGLVGLALLGAALLAIAATTAARARGPDRALYAAVLAVTLAWAGRAAIDWDWEMPGVTLWVFAVGGAVLAASVRADGGESARRVRRDPGLRTAMALLAVLAALPAFAIIRSERQLDVAQSAFEEGDCVRAGAAARASLRAVARRPEPHEVLGLCATRFELWERGVGELERAVALAPEDWRFHYSLALARGAGGRDPRPDLRAALRLNPLEERVRTAARRLDTADRRAWRRVGQTAELHGDLNG